MIIKVKDSWCVTPNYKGLENIKVELQIRTVLMHTWAAIEHKLGYKNNQELPKNLKRKLYLMSAQLENADMQFQEIKDAAEDFQHITVEESKRIGKFTADKLNIDTLQALLEFYFHKYENNMEMEIAMLDQIIKNNLSIENLIEYAEKITPYINDIVSRLTNNRPSRINFLKYALEIFAPQFPIIANEKRKEIIKAIKNLYQKNNKFKS